MWSFQLAIFPVCCTEDVPFLPWHIYLSGLLYGRCSHTSLTHLSFRSIVRKMFLSFLDTSFRSTYGRCSLPSLTHLSFRSVVGRCSFPSLTHLSFRSVVRKMFLSFLDTFVFPVCCTEDVPFLPWHIYLSGLLYGRCSFHSLTHFNTYILTRCVQLIFSSLAMVYVPFCPLSYINTCYSVQHNF